VADACCDACGVAKSRLKEAQDAYHDLQLTGAVTLSRSDGKEVRYAATDADRLSRYIGVLACAVADACGTARPAGRRIFAPSMR
jgi:gpW